MKTHPSLLTLLAVALFAAIPGRAETSATPADDKPVLHVTVIEALTASGNAYTDFNRFETGFQKAVKQRKWPTKVSVERFAGNTPDYATELRITLQRVRRDPIEDYVFRAWAILVVNGQKHDFGIVTSHYNARLGENFDDVLDKSFGGGAAAIAEKVEPVLFPELNPKKKK
jgi:hypothetical protein